jgi:hypothetical protein
VCAAILVLVDVGVAALVALGDHARRHRNRVAIDEAQALQEVRGRVEAHAPRLRHLVTHDGRRRLPAQRQPGDAVRGEADDQGEQRGNADGHGQGGVEDPVHPSLLVFSEMVQRVGGKLGPGKLIA